MLHKVNLCVGGIIGSKSVCWNSKDFIDKGIKKLMRGFYALTDRVYYDLECNVLKSVWKLRRFGVVFKRLAERS